MVRVVRSYNKLCHETKLDVIELMYPEVLAGVICTP